MLSAYLSNGSFVTSSVSAGFTAYDTQRNITFLNQAAHEETQDLSEDGRLATGYDFMVKNLIMGPTAYSLLNANMLHSGLVNYWP